MIFGFVSDIDNDSDHRKYYITIKTPSKTIILLHNLIPILKKKQLYSKLRKCNISSN